MGDYIVCYDIRNPKRLARVHRAIKKHAMALQYSVFLFTGTAQQLQHCLSQLETLIDKRTDDIRAYPIPQRGFRMHLGQPPLPAGIHWSGLPIHWQ
ncbi:MAG: CRISPR-associated endonuclease Cas2 [Pseudoxanthomonas sp.]